MEKLTMDDLRRIAAVCNEFQERLDALGLGSLDVEILTDETPKVLLVLRNPEDLPEDLDIKVSPAPYGGVMRDAMLEGCRFRQISSL